MAFLVLVPAIACDDTLAAPAASGDDILVTVSGTVKLNGEPPPIKVNKAIGNDPACAALHAAPPPLETLLVAPDGGVRWAFVWVKSGLENQKFPAPQAGPFIDQKGCNYSPRVVGIQVGQPVNFRNMDPLLHNVHGLPWINKPWNVGQLQATVHTVRPAQPESNPPITVKCDVHPWMSAFIFVLEHPYFAVTDEAGKFSIPNLPAGKYTLGVWHEGLKTTDGKNEVEIVVKENKTVDFVMMKK